MSFTSGETLTASDLNTSFSSEAAARANAITTLTNNLTTEQNTRSTADTNLNNAINAEASARATNDATTLASAKAYTDAGIAGVQLGVSVMAKGAVGNGSTDDTAAWLAAIASLGAKGGNVFVPKPPASYVLSGTITLPNGVALVGDYGRPRITAVGGSYTLFSLTGSDTSVRNFLIDSTSKGGGKDISIDAGSNGPGSGLQRIMIENVYGNNSYGLVGDSGSGNGLYLDLKVRNCIAFAARGNAFSFTRFFSEVVVEDCTASFGGSTNPNFAGFAVDNTPLASVGAVGGIALSRCFALGTSTNGANPSQQGYSIVNTTAVWINDCDADSMDRFGFNIANVEALYMVNSTAGLTNDVPMLITGCTDTQLNGVTIYGRKVVPGSAANVPGLELASGNSTVAISNLSVFDCTGDGILVGSTQGPINIQGGMIARNVGVGLQTIGDSAVLAGGLIFLGNGSDYSLSGPFHALTNSVLNSGALVTVQGPGAVG